jgi:Ala-tRNA(Pro) deacylase
MISPRVRAFLDDERVRYEVLAHRQAYTAQGVAHSVHTSGWKVAKVLLVRDSEAGHLLAVLPASCQLDIERLRRVTDRPGLELAPELEMSRLFPDCVPGAIPPFGRLYGMPVYVDSCFPHTHEVVFQAGTHREVVRMPYLVYEALARPTIADFCSH